MLVSIGDNCIDHYVAPIEMQQVGGNALNVAANLALHRLPAAYAGVVGTDAHGELVLAALESIGVNAACVERRAGRTGVTQIELLQGDYRILEEDYGVSGAVDCTPALLAFLRARASRIHLTVSGQAERLIETLADTAIPLSVDLGVVREPSTLQRYAPLLARAESAFLSVGAKLQDDAVSDLLSATVRQGPRHAIATRGAAGACGLWQGRLISVPALLETRAVVDTVGAGDAFIAGFLASTGGPEQLEERLRCASRWAAEACSHMGAWRAGRPAAVAAAQARRP